jgi:hypothetical protein
MLCATGDTSAARASEIGRNLRSRSGSATAPPCKRLVRLLSDAASLPMQHPAGFAQLATSPSMALAGTFEHKHKQPMVDLLGLLHKLGEMHRRRNRIAEMITEEARDLTTDGHVRNVGVQIEAVDTGEIETDMTVQHVIDVRHARHEASVHARGLALPARQHQRSVTRAGRRPGGLAPLPF